MHKKLLLVGYLPHDSSIYAYATSFVSPLQKLGFEVKNFNYRDHFFKNNWFKPFRIINHYLINRQLLKTAKAFKPDIVFCIKAETITPQTLIAIKKQCNSYLINFHPDSPFALWNGNSTVNIIRSFRIYDHFLTWSHELAPALVSAGCKKVSYFPFAFDKELYVQAVSSLRPFAATADKPSCPGRHSHLGDGGTSPENKQSFACDVSFVGTWEPEREQWLNIICEKLPTIDLAIWGNEWKKNIPPSSPLYSKIRGDAIYGQTMRKAFANSKINLNFIRQQNIQAHNMRTFEVPANNSFLLTQRTHDQANILFKEGESIACFATPSELIEQITFYLEHETERSVITQKGFLCAQKFTLETQLAMLCKTLFIT